MTRGRTARGGAVLALAAAWLMLSATSAAAHAGLVSSDPSAGAALGASPSAIRLTFSERPAPSLSNVIVRSKRGVQYQSGAPVPAGNDPLAFVVPVRALPRGVYTVDWRVDSSVDGHKTTGAYSFGVGVPASELSGARTGSSTPVTSPLEVVARWLFLLGLVLLVGALAGALAGFGGRSLALGGIGWGVAALGLLVLAEAQRRNADASFRTLFASDIGGALIWRAAALGAAGLALLIASRAARARRTALAAAAAATLAAIVVHVANGHAANSGSWPSALTVTMQSIHLAVAGVWAGGLATLVYGIRGEPSAAKAAAVRRFSLVAAIGLATIAVSGIVRAFSELRSWGELTSTAYGVGVLVKLALVAVIAWLGWRARRRAVPVALSDLRPLRRGARLELALAVAAIGVAALLGTLGPPVSVAYSGLVGLSAAGADSTHSVRVDLTTASSDPGANTFTVGVDGYDSGDPLMGLAVSLRFTPLDDPGVKPTALSLAPEAGHRGTYTAVGTNLRFDGRWGVLAIVRHGRGAVGVPLELTTATPVQPLSVQRIPGQAPVYSKLVGQLSLISISPAPERAGPSTVAIGAYTASLGDELPVSGIVVTAAAGDGPTHQQPVTRTGKGTFAAHLTLAAGRDQIAVIAHLRGVGRLRSVFELTVPAS